MPLPAALFVLRRLRVLVPLAALLALTTALAGCTEDEPAPVALPPAPEPEPDPEPDPDRRFAEALTGHRGHSYKADLDEIKRKGVLRVITRNNSTSYFLYRGQEAGFHYEIAKLFADSLGVRLEMVAPRANRDVIPWLLEGRGDIIMAGLPTDAPRVDRVRLTRPYLRTPLVVVARKGRVPAIEELEDLSQATVMVRPSSSAMRRLREISKETDIDLHIRGSRETLEAEDILDLVAAGEADVTVLERRIVDVELFHRDDIEIALELPGEPVEAAFATRKGDTRLWEAAQTFLKKEYRGLVWNMTYTKYHRNKERAQNNRDDELRGDKGAFSPWDEIFQSAARDAGIDWRILVSQAVQESRLDPKAKSSFGAQGIMQIMPRTAQELGVKDPWDPQQSIEGGARYMKKLIARFDDELELKDRVRFALASYNAGPGHLDDARKLAVQQGLDGDRWFGNVEKAMLLLSKPRYYRKARYGYCRGEEPVRYVSQIQSRYDHYVALTDPPPPSSGEPEANAATP